MKGKNAEEHSTALLCITLEQYIGCCLHTLTKENITGEKAQLKRGCMQSQTIEEED